jgi:hypothetical protein
MSRRLRLETTVFGLAAALAALGLAGAAVADEDAAAEPVGDVRRELLEDKVAREAAEQEEAEETRQAWKDYGSSVGTRYLVALNSLVTFPADPVMGAVQPREEFDELPLAVATKWPVGFVQGTMLSMYRAAMGSFDIVFAPLTPMKMLSPEPRYMIFPDVEHPEY